VPPRHPLTAGLGPFGRTDGHGPVGGC
jgi:hypothetical protein